MFFHINTASKISPFCRTGRGIIIILKMGSSCKSVGELISLNQYSMASDKDKRVFNWVNKTV
jgi:hypothetical protein